MKYRGIVKPNTRNGTRLGYPTANISISGRSHKGVFAGYTTLVSSTDPQVIHLFYENKLPSLIFIGRPNIAGDKTFRLETHVLDLPMIELYAAEIEVRLSAKLRDSKSFADTSDLIRQMKLDEQKARAWFDRSMK